MITENRGGHSKLGQVIKTGAVTKNGGSQYKLIQSLKTGVIKLVLLPKAGAVTKSGIATNTQFLGGVS